MQKEGLWLGSDKQIVSKKFQARRIFKTSNYFCKMIFNEIQSISKVYSSFAIIYINPVIN